MFRYKSGIKVPYKRQMYIYSISRLYNELDEKSQAKIRELCAEYGGEYERALFEFVTTDTTATALEMKYYLSRATLYRAVRKYYQNFPKQL